MSLSSAQIAELLARKAGAVENIQVRAFRRAARSEFLWPEQAQTLFAQGPR